MPKPTTKTTDTGTDPVQPDPGALATRPETFGDAVVGGQASTDAPAPTVADTLADAGTAAAAVTLAGQPAAAASAAADILGSAREAPGIGSGPAGDPAAPVVDPIATTAAAPAGVAAGIFSKEGSFGADIPTYEAAARHLGGLSPTASRGEVERAFAAVLDARFGPAVGTEANLGAYIRSAIYDTLDVGNGTTSPILGADGQPVKRAAEFDLRITARRDGFRRGGIAHPSQPTLRRSADFTMDELRQIEAEPMLFVEQL